MYHCSWGHHIHYDLEFRGFSVSDSRSFAWRHKGKYCQFGVVGCCFGNHSFVQLDLYVDKCGGCCTLCGCDKYEKNEERNCQKKQRISYPLRKHWCIVIILVQIKTGMVLYSVVLDLISKFHPFSFYNPSFYQPNHTP